MSLPICDHSEFGVGTSCELKATSIQRIWKKKIEKGELGEIYATLVGNDIAFIAPMLIYLTNDN